MGNLNCLDLRVFLSVILGIWNLHRPWLLIHWYWRYTDKEWWENLFHANPPFWQYFPVFCSICHVNIHVFTVAKMLCVRISQRPCNGMRAQKKERNHQPIVFPFFIISYQFWEKITAHNITSLLQLKICWTMKRSAVTILDKKLHS